MMKSKIVRSLFLIASLVTLLIDLRGKADQTPQPDEYAPKVYFEILHSPGPKWDHKKPLQKQALIKNHFKYRGQFAANKKLVMGGPFLDNSGGMGIFEAKTISDVETIAKNDPAVKSGLLKAKVKAWMVDRQANGKGHRGLTIIGTKTYAK